MLLKVVGLVMVALVLIVVVSSLILHHAGPNWLWVFWIGLGLTLLGQWIDREK